MPRLPRHYHSGPVRTVGTGWTDLGLSGVNVSWTGTLVSAALIVEGVGTNTSWDDFYLDDLSVTKQ